MTDDAPRTPAFLAGIRNHRRRRGIALVVAGILGLAVAWIHWLGLFVAGGLVGVVSRTLPRAVLAGFVLGLITLVVGILTVPGTDVGEFLAFRPPVYVTVAAGLGAPVWGSLIRSVI